MLLQILVIGSLAIKNHECISLEFLITYRIYKKNLLCLNNKVRGETTSLGLVASINIQVKEIMPKTRLLHSKIY